VADVVSENRFTRIAGATGDRQARNLRELRANLSLNFTDTEFLR
jgi:hypothetical protein